MPTIKVPAQFRKRLIGMKSGGVYNCLIPKTSNRINFQQSMPKIKVPAQFIKRFIRMKSGGVYDCLGSPLGGIYDCRGSENSAEIESLARFSVQKFNEKENALLEFARVLKAREQVVAGTMYYLTLEAMVAGNKKIYEAKVWVKPWMNFQESQEFKHAGDDPSFTLQILVLNRREHVKNDDEEGIRNCLQPCSFRCSGI